jgi:hypothetical protein
VSFFCAKKGELEAALGDAEAALEQEENKFLRLSLEINQASSRKSHECFTLKNIFVCD